MNLSTEEPGTSWLFTKCYNYDFYFPGLALHNAIMDKKNYKKIYANILLILCASLAWADFFKC